MRLFHLALFFLLLAPAFAGAQAISINTDASNPDLSAILDVKSSDKGMLVPRMTTAQRTAIATPAAGLLVYDTDTDSFWYFDNGIWNQVASIAVLPPLASGANNTVIPIPDNNPTGITSIINLTQGGVIDASTQIKVCIDITHTNDAHLDISLTAPDGTTIDLSSDNGSFNDNYTNTCFVTALAPGITSGVAPFTGFWTPEQPFSNFINKPIMGNWTLKVVDDSNTDVGQLNGWSIEIPSKSIAPALLSDKDSDTKVQVEKNPDEDIIRFELSGTEGMVLRKTAAGSPRLELPDGLANTFIGQSAGASNITGYQNTANGYNALYSNTTGRQNTANGYQALAANTTGSNNTAIGLGALSSNTTGTTNTAIGLFALSRNTGGGDNTAIGKSSLPSNTTGSTNTAIGSQALINNTTGYNNIAIGFNGLGTNTTGAANTALGHAADVLAGDLTNATAIGYNAKVGASNSLVLGGTGADAVNVGVGTSIPAASAILDLQATDKGMLVPRMTSAERTAIATPATGLLVYETTSNAFWFYNGTAWAKISPQTLLADADNDTKVQVEKNLDEDIIRFDLSGTESMVLRKNASGRTRLELPDMLGNTFVGKNVGLANTTGNFNTAHGEGALAQNTIGTQNTANGYYALFSNTTGSQNAAFGNAALSGNNAGSGNAALGMQALTGNTTGNENTASGSYALFGNTTGHSNTGLGSQALFFNSTGQGNTAAGHSALFNNTTGFSNVALGKDALYNNTDRSNLVAVGDSALYNNGTGATGSQATNNTAIGSKALFSNTTGHSNTANGTAALFSNTTAYWNTANGSEALFSNTTGVGNTASGIGALYYNTTANYNTANGARALFHNNTGYGNTANGVFALAENTTGYGNTALGKDALKNNASGNNNTAIGSSAASGATAHNNCTFVGADIAITTNRTNVSVLGYSVANAQCTADNQVLLGNTGIGQIRAQVTGITAYSDGRFKTNVQQDVPGLDFISKLKPVTYNQNPELLHRIWGTPDSVLARIDHSDIKGKRFIGFVAQEVEQAARACNFEFPGIDAPNQPNEVYTLRYVDFIMPLVKGMQEQQAVINELKAENAAQKAENAAMKAQLDKITAALQTAGISLENR